MVNGSRASAAGMRPAMLAQEILANNLANASTAGFRQDRIAFQQLYTGRSTLQGFGMASPQIVSRIDPRPGVLEVTDRPLDLAIDGDGYFAVSTPDGERYTRAGHFVLSSEGTLTTPQGFPVLSEGGPLTLPGDVPVSITSNGTLRGEERTYGRVRIVRFEPNTPMRHAGAGLLIADGDAEAAENARVLQGVIEGANVSPVQAMVEMITLLRHFEMNQKALRTQDETLGQLLSWVRA